MNLPISKLVKHQKLHVTKIDSNKDRIAVMTLDYDDKCGNNHNTFNMTSCIYAGTQVKAKDLISAGCNHMAIAEMFPQFKKYIKWHGCSTEGPLHYIVNTLYFSRQEEYLFGARACAIWEGASLEQLQSEGALMKRLPSLMLEFKKDMEELGFTY